MRLAAALVVFAACAHARPPVLRSQVPVPRTPEARAPRPPSAWPVPVRVMGWTSDGIVQLGELPDHPPATPPAVPWFVEPEQPLDGETFTRLVAAVRSEHVPGLSLKGQRVALDALVDLPELTALVLDDTDVADPAALKLTLARLYLARTPVDDAAIARVVAAQPNLEVIDVEDCAVGDAAARDIAKLHELRAVNLSGTRLSDAGGAALGALAHLEIVDLGRTDVGAKTLAALRPLAIRELFLDQTRAGPELATLDGFAPGIVRLDVSNLAAYKPTDRDLAWLTTAPNLVEAGLSGSRVHDATVRAIARLPNLRDIRLAGTPITLAGIGDLAKLPALEEIDLAETPVDDATAAQLIALPKLRMLRLDRTPIDDAALHAAPGPALTELYLAKTKVGDPGTELLYALPHLTALGLGETLVGDATLGRIAQLHDLRTLVLSATRASTHALGGLANLHALERLYLDQTQADDSTIEALAQARELRVLHLEGTNVSDAALATLRTFDRLEELTIGDSRARGVIGALDAWPRLRTLSVLGLDLDDRALPAIAKRPSLVTLDVSATEVTSPAALAALPRLRLLGLSQLHLTRDGEAAATALHARGVEIVR